MPNLNKRQIEFRKQIQELQNIKTYKDIMNNHDSFYHNTALENELKYKAALREKKKNYIIGLIILFFIISAIYYNFNSIKEFYNSKFNSNNFSNITKQVIYKVSSVEIEQNKVGVYNKNFASKVENMNNGYSNLTKNIEFPYYNVKDMKIQLNIINKYIIDFESYKPDEINKELHLYNIRILYSLKDNYEYKIYATNTYYPESTSIYYTGDQFNLYENKRKYREILLSILNKLNMDYKVFENGKIEFKYPDI